MGASPRDARKIAHIFGVPAYLIDTGEGSPSRYWVRLRKGKPLHRTNWKRRKP